MPGSKKINSENSSVSRGFINETSNIQFSPPMENLPIAVPVSDNGAFPYEVASVAMPNTGDLVAVSVQRDPIDNAEEIITDYTRQLNQIKSDLSLSLHYQHINEDLYNNIIDRIRILQNPVILMRLLSEIHEEGLNSEFLRLQKLKQKFHKTINGQLELLNSQDMALNPNQITCLRKVILHLMNQLSQRSLLLEPEQQMQLQQLTLQIPELLRKQCELQNERNYVKEHFTNQLENLKQLDVSIQNLPKKLDKLRKISVSQLPLTKQGCKTRLNHGFQLRHRMSTGQIMPQLSLENEQILRNVHGKQISEPQQTTQFTSCTRYSSSERNNSCIY